MNIEVAKLSDAKNVLRLYNQSRNLNGCDSIKYETKDIVDYIKKDSLFIAKIGSKTVAAMYLEIHTTYIYLHTLVVDVKYRGQGIGAELLQFSEDIAKRKKLRLIEMMIEENNDVMKKCITKRNYVCGKKFVYYTKKLK